MIQDYTKYTAQDQEVWNLLFKRQYKNLKDKASDRYIEALDGMSEVLHPNAIPVFDEINQWFEDQTGWRIHVVPGLIPVRDFFDLLAQKKFCSSTWLRSKSQMDYLEEPDMFHDIFGHIPLLSNHSFSSFAQEFGRLGKAVSADEEKVIQLQRLYWFTIEFGLIEEAEKSKAYGAGIISSYGELNRVAKKECRILDFDIQKVFNHEFRTDVMQEEYFLIEEISQLEKSLFRLSSAF